MPKIAVKSIQFGERGRKDYGDVQGLAESLKTHGLIEPIVIDDNNLLVAGGRRLTAAILAGWDEIDYHLRSDLTPRKLKQLELEENIQRKDLLWQEKAKMTKEIEDLLKEENPNVSQEEVAAVAHTSTGKVSEDLMLLKVAEKCPEILKVKDKKAAVTMARRHKAAELRAVVVEAMETPKLAQLFNGDARELFKNIPDESVDLILMDPPYGVNIHTGGKTPKGNWREGWSKTYDDSTQNAILLMDELIREAARVLKPGAHCYIFFGLQLELETSAIRDTIEQYLNFQRSPLIWAKNTHSNKDPYQRFGLNYEPFYFCWKGTQPRDLLRARMAVFNIAVNTKEKQHPSEKPEALYKELIEIATHKGETVLDPTAGSGMSLATAVALDRRAVGFELDPTWFDLMRVNVDRAETGLVPSSSPEDGTDKISK